MRIPKTCIVCGRRGVAGTSRCERHQLPPVSEADRRRRHPYRAAYDTEEYRRNRGEAFERAHGRCEHCGKPLGPNWTCDHMVPVRDRGSSDLGNLQILCAPCTKDKNREDKRRRRDA
jgi:5-methylcytosine-specific restriction endonuclease McrA